MEQKWKDIKGLEVTISHYESSLGRAQVQPEETPASEDDLSDSGAKGAKEAEMATTPVADDAPPVSTMPEPLTPLQVRNRHIPWGWMMGMIANLQLAPSPTGRMSS